MCVHVWLGHRNRVRVEKDKNMLLCGGVANESEREAKRSLNSSPIAAAFAEAANKHPTIVSMSLLSSPSFFSFSILDKEENEMLQVHEIIPRMLFFHIFEAVNEKHERGGKGGKIVKSQRNLISCLMNGVVLTSNAKPYNFTFSLSAQRLFSPREKKHERSRVKYLSLYLSSMRRKYEKDRNCTLSISGRSSWVLILKKRGEKWRRNDSGIPTHAISCLVEYF